MEFKMDGEIIVAILVALSVCFCVGFTVTTMKSCTLQEIQIKKETGTLQKANP